MKHAKPFELAFEMAVLSIERYLYGKQPHGKHLQTKTPPVAAGGVSSSLGKEKH